MSDPSAETRRAPGTAVILGIAAGLMICAVLAAFLILSRGGPVDGTELLERTFGVRTVGERYVIVEARELPTGARIVMMDDKEAPPEPSRGAGSPENSEPIDWTKLTIPEAHAAPRRLVFVFPKAGSAQASIDAFFLKSEWMDISDVGKTGGKVVIAAKKIPWRSFDADWVHERVFEVGLTFRDAINVNVSQQDRPCVMTALWTRGETASEEALKPILAALAGDKQN